MLKKNPENHANFGTVPKSMVEPGRPQMTIQNGAYVIHAGYVRLQTHTQNT